MPGHQGWRQELILVYLSQPNVYVADPTYWVRLLLFSIGPELGVYIAKANVLNNGKDYDRWVSKVETLSIVCNIPGA